jgi:diaminopimelate epimerase
MNLNFTKMHGIGNDFVVIDAINQDVSLNTEQIRFIADRRFGVGCDQLLLVERSQQSDADFRYRIFNADGGEVEQCGNGARCFARFVHEKRLTDKTTIDVETLGGPLQLQIEDDGQVTVNMGLARLEPKDIPFVADQASDHYSIEVEGKNYTIGAVSMGNPHAVMRVENVYEAPVYTLGPKIEHHTRFPNRVNVGFMQVMSRDHIQLRVWERGAGETLACGTGACAAVISGQLQGWLDSTVKVDLPGGRLVVSCSDIHQPVMMTGPAETVFEGKIQL